MPNETDKRLAELTAKLERAFGERLLSVVLYGSAGASAVGMQAEEERRATGKHYA